MKYNDSLEVRTAIGKIKPGRYDNEYDNMVLDTIAKYTIKANGMHDCSCFLTAGEIRNIVKMAALIGYSLGASEAKAPSKQNRVYKYPDKYLKGEVPGTQNRVHKYPKGEVPMVRISEGTASSIRKK